MRPRIRALVVALSLCCSLAAAGSEPAAPRLAWSGPGVNLLGAPSRDGRYLSYVDAATHNLAIREIASGRSRLLTSKPAGSAEFAYFSSISPDGRRVAYAWFNAQGFYDLRVIDLDGSQARILYHNEEAGFVQPCAWSPDSQLILTLLFRSDNISQIALVPAAGGPPKVLRSLNWVYPKRMDLSPDGRSIVYDSFAGDSSGDRTLFLLSADGQRERKLLDLPGSHLFPLWTPDGKHIVYASERSGAMDLLELAVENGEPHGAPRLLRHDAGRILPMGITTSGEFFYGLRSGLSDIFVASMGDLTASARRATLRFPGRNIEPAWSADGNALVYLSRRGSENFGEESRALVVRRLDSDDERELLPKLAHLERARWSPNGKELLVSGSDGKGRGGLFRVDAQTGAVQPVIVQPGASFRGFEAVWSRDGRSVFYLRGNAELRSLDLASGGETMLYRGASLHHLAIAPDGKRLAVGLGGHSIALLPAAGGTPQMIAFDALTELEWGRDLVAGKGAGLWRVPLDGSPPVRLAGPNNREPGFSLHPNGQRIALTAGSERSEVWVWPLP